MNDPGAYRHRTSNVINDYLALFYDDDAGVLQCIG